MFKKTLLSAAVGVSIAAIFATQSFAGSLLAQPANKTDLLLSAEFEPRAVTKIEVGDFHFKPGQRAPVHTHEAPAFGYVTEGSILYKVEGREPVLMHAGDVYYEPAGPIISMFDNASTTKGAVFIDINLQQEDETFILFENPPTEAIDRRTLPETNYANSVTIDGGDVYSHTLQPDAKQYVDVDHPISVYIAEGDVDVRMNGKRVKRLKAGDVFYEYKKDGSVVFTNTSSQKPAKVIVFKLHKAG